MATNVLGAHFLVALPATCCENDRFGGNSERPLGVFRYKAHDGSALVGQKLCCAGSQKRGAALLGENLSELLQVLVGVALGTFLSRALAAHPNVRAVRSELFGDKAHAVDPLNVGCPVVANELAELGIRHGGLCVGFVPVGSEAGAESACGKAAGASNMLRSFNENDVGTRFGGAHGCG